MFDLDSCDSWNGLWQALASNNTDEWCSFSPTKTIREEIPESLKRLQLEEKAWWPTGANGSNHHSVSPNLSVKPYLLTAVRISIAGFLAAGVFYNAVGGQGVSEDAAVKAQYQCLPQDAVDPGATVPRHGRQWEETCDRLSALEELYRHTIAKIPMSQLLKNSGKEGKELVATNH